MLNELLDVFDASGFLFKEGLDVFESNPLLDAEDIADALWLALQWSSDSMLSSEQPDDSSEEGEPLSANTVDGTQASSSSSMSSVAAYTRSSLESQRSKASADVDESLLDEGLPIRVQSAPSLREAQTIGRALRPLRRTVPFPLRYDIDEEATVDRIAKQDIWVPVLRAAPERWLDVELVVESSSFSFIWESTLDEFQRVLERQGAFRAVRTWRLGTVKGELRLQPKSHDARSSYSRSLKELMSSSSRSVILLVSDCRSFLWQQGKIHGWLKHWGRNTPTSILQLLPERLWSESELDVGFGVRVSSRTPGASNPHLVVRGLPVWEEVDAADALVVPVVPLSAQALSQWANVIAGVGHHHISARLFDLSWVKDASRSADDGFDMGRSPAERVEHFFATASPLAQRLAMLMAAVPVDLSVVHLIQAEMLPESTYVHVSEVYSSALLLSLSPPIGHSEVSTIGEPSSSYGFVPGVREILNRLNPVDDTESVLEALSQAIGRRLGFEIDHFSALLLPKANWSQEQKDTILPFARIATGVLYQLGGEYAALADIVVADARRREDWILKSDPPFTFPSSQWLEFDTARYQESDTPSFPPLQSRSLQILSIEVDLSTPAHQTLDFEYVTLEERRRRWEPVRHPAQCRQYIEALMDEVGLEMVFIPAGTFMMGEGDKAHEVSVPAFYMGKYVVTQVQWKAVAEMDRVDRDLKAAPSRFKGRDLPVERVSWHDAIEFCQRLSIYTQRHYRLPSEAEWEYACRAATTTAFHFGDMITTDVANYAGVYTYNDGPTGEYRKKTISVGSLNTPNKFGLHDMHGNVWEWCEDDYHSGYKDAPTDGSAWIDEPRDDCRILRGGSWYDSPSICRSAYRPSNSRDDRFNRIGFRVVVSAPELSGS